MNEQTSEWIDGWTDRQMNNKQLYLLGIILIHFLEPQCTISSFELFFSFW